MRAPVRQPMFDGIIYNVAPGNVSTLFHCVNPETKDTYIVMCGMTILPKEDSDESVLNDFEQRNELNVADVKHIMEVPSIPYMLDFYQPVFKVACGDMFAALLTCEGNVFTWGYNNYG